MDAFSRFYFIYIYDCLIYAVFFKIALPNHTIVTRSLNVDICLLAY